MCIDCQSFLAHVNRFVGRAKEINSMFNEITSLEQGFSHNIDLNKIRCQYKLEPISEYELDKILEIKIEDESDNKCIEEDEIPESTENPFKTEEIEIKVEEESFDENFAFESVTNQFEADNFEDMEDESKMPEMSEDKDSNDDETEYNDNDDEDEDDDDEVENPLDKMFR